MIRFKARLNRPAPSSAKADSWTFLVLPKAASAKLPSRGMTPVSGTMNGHPFRATLEPDGMKGHWLKASRKLREAAGAQAGDVVRIEITPGAKEREPRVPADLRKALASSAKAQDVWKDITPVARRDWVQWIVSAKQAQTRARRIENARKRLASGKRRVCCFDRSGFYGGNFRAPEAADPSP